MNNASSQIPKKILIEIAIVVLIVGAIVGYSEYRRYTLADDLETLTLKFDQTVAEFASSTEALSVATRQLDSRLGVLITENSSLSNSVQSVQNNSSVVQEQIGKIYDTADTLTKLSKTDPQLLQKYSKVYFLNEHYVPAKLTPIDTAYLFNKSSGMQIHASVWPHLQSLLSAAKANGQTIQVISAFRSFGTQAALKSRYTVTYGAGTANQFSADQGYSEHQLGTTLDFTTPAAGAAFVGFEKDPAYTWLINNAYKYGFILSYPETNKYYEYEPWHWRYVGVDLATRLHRDGKNFYDLDQRVINDYLPLIFD